MSKTPVRVACLLVCSLSFSHSDPQGRTKTLNFYRVGPRAGQLVVVDAPGYGLRGRPEWGKVFDSFIENRTTYVR